MVLPPPILPQRRTEPTELRFRATPRCAFCRTCTRPAGGTLQPFETTAASCYGLAEIPHTGGHRFEVLPPPWALCPVLVRRTGRSCYLRIVLSPRGIALAPRHDATPRPQWRWRRLLGGAPVPTSSTLVPWFVSPAPTSGPRLSLLSSPEWRCAKRTKTRAVPLSRAPSGRVYSDGASVVCFLGEGKSL